MPSNAETVIYFFQIMSDNHYIHNKIILWTILVFFASWRLGWTILIWLFVLILIVLLFRCLRTLAGKLNLIYILMITYGRFQNLCIKSQIFHGPLSRRYRRLLGVCSWPSWSSSKSLPNFQGARYLSCKSPSSCPKSIFKKDFRYSMSK